MCNRIILLLSEHEALKKARGEAVVAREAGVGKKGTESFDGRGAILIRGQPL